MTKLTLVVLEVLDDIEDREWWEALGLPAPERINEDADRSHVAIRLERKIDRGTPFDA